MTILTRVLLVFLALVLLSVYATAVFVNFVYNVLRDLHLVVVGYAVLLVTVPSLLLLFVDFVAYAFASLPACKHVPNILRLLHLVFYGYLPVAVLTVPAVAVGLVDVFSGGMFYEASVFTLFVWDVVIAFYALYIHIVYAPYAASIAVIAAFSGSSFWKSFRRMVRLLPRVAAVSIASSILGSFVANALALAMPGLASPLIVLEDVPGVPEWVRAAKSAMPRYSSIIADLSRYVFYTVFAVKLLAGRLCEKREG